MTEGFRKSLFLLFAAFLLIGMGTPLQAQVPTFRIGVIDDLGGDLVQGARLAVEQINDAGGVIGADGTAFQLQIILQTPDDIAFAVANFRQASVIAVIGPAMSGTVLANRGTLTSLGVPVLTPALDDTITSLDESNLFVQTRATATMQSAALARYLVEELAAASLATVQLDLESTVGVVGFERAARDLGLPVGNALVLDENSTVDSIAAQLNTSRPQFVVAYGPPGPTAQLFSALLEGGFSGRLAYDRAGEPTFRDLLPADALLDVISVDSWSSALTDDISSDFLLAYVRAFAAVPSGVSVAGYDSVFLLQEAIRQPGNLIPNLRGITLFDGVQGNYRAANANEGKISTNAVVTELGIFGVPVVGARQINETLVIVEEENPIVSVFASPTATPLPTNTPTRTNTPTPLPTATPDGVFIEVTVPVQNVRTGPGTNYDVIGQLDRGTRGRVIGANAGFTWVVITFRGTNGWLSADLLDITGNPNTVPIIPNPPTPTPPPATPTPITPTPPPSPDLVVTSAQPGRLTIGQPFTVNAVLRNAGSAAAGPFAVAASFEPGNVFSAVNLQGLAGTGQITIQLTGQLVGPTGPYEVAIVADLNNQVQEGPTGETNNIFSFTYIADAAVIASSTTTLQDRGVFSLDGGSDDFQWGGGGIAPLGNTQLVRITNFTNIASVHRDALINLSASNNPVPNVTPGTLVGVLTDGGQNIAVIEVTAAAPNGPLTFNYRTYAN